MFVFDVNINLRYHLITGIYLQLLFPDNIPSTCHNLTTNNVLFPLKWCQDSWDAFKTYQSPNMKELFITEVHLRNKKENIHDFKIFLSNNQLMLNESSVPAQLIVEFKTPKAGIFSLIYY